MTEFGESMPGDRVLLGRIRFDPANQGCNDLVSSSFDNLDRSSSGENRAEPPNEPNRRKLQLPLCIILEVQCCLHSR